MPTIKSSFPRPITEIENFFIPLSDGARLAARMWLPADAEQDPVPAILEYLPYRKDDGTAYRDSIRHPYFAGHGYACLRVDMRGSGDSDGLMLDEYLKQEQDDALEVLRWIAAQKWYRGGVGIIGISWGGFNGLQIAARRPPELKAVVTVCSTDDRYADDVHYMGGCVLASEMLEWASVMLALNAQPPDPRFRPDWREVWLERMEKTPAYIEAWLSHQRRDAFWRHGSVGEDFSAVTAPVYAVGGWQDGYTNAVPRLLAGLSGPRKGLIGPWSHGYPEVALPGPQIGFQQECLRWWDHWLKGRDTGIMDEPMLTAWVQTAAAPQSYYDYREGRWVALQSWPAAEVGSHSLHLSQAGLSPDPTPAAGGWTLKGSQHCGQTSGIWCPYGKPGDIATDQRPDDGLSLTFDSAPAPAVEEILGFPQVTLDLASDKPNALVAVRLCDVAPDGASTLVTWGQLNLTHRDSHTDPQPLVPGQRYTVNVRLNVIGYTLPAGHRWRVAVSPTYWPHAWPSPEAVTLTVYGGQLRLPALTAGAHSAALPAHWSRPEHAQPMTLETMAGRNRERTVVRDQVTGRLTVIDKSERGYVRFLPAGLENDYTTTDTFSILEGQPLSASVRSDRHIIIGRGPWQTRIETASTMTSTATDFLVTNQLEAFEGEVRVFAKTWRFTVARDLV
jgi:putative CocE/NonD family hydrolase